MEHSIIIYHASLLLTGKSGESELDNGWLQLENGEICGIGQGETYRQYIQSNTTLIDAEGRSVLPGFIDNHFHVVHTALYEDQPDFSMAKNYEDIGRIICNIVPESETEILVGRGLDSTLLAEKMLPGRMVLDRYCSNKPLVIYSKDYHTLMLNTYAVLFFKVPYGLNGVEKDAMDVPTGIFTKQAAAKLDKVIVRSVTQRKRGEKVGKFIPTLLENGITTLAAMEGGNITNNLDKDDEAEFILQNRASYPVDMEVFYQTVDETYASSLGLQRIGGALYLDGTLGSHTAALSFSYADIPDGKGVLFFTQEDLDAFVLRCCDRNLQISLDVIGDAAIEMALLAFENAAKRFDVANMRHRLEHAELISPQQILRAKELGIILSVQPAYEGLWGHIGGMYQQRLGTHYGKTNPFRLALDSGVELCGGSDSDVTPINPLVGIYWGVNHPIKTSRITVREALRMYTYSGAYALKLENQVGSLYPGKRADVVILDRDILQTDPAQLQEVQVDMTIKSGEILFDRGRRYA